MYSREKHCCCNVHSAPSCAGPTKTHDPPSLLSRTARGQRDGGSFAVGVEVGVAVAVGVASLGGKGSVAAESGSGRVSGHDPEMISGARS